MITTLPHIVNNSAELFPDKEAFRCNNDSITYAELNMKTNQLAKLLLGLGVKKGDRIGIYLNRCLESVIAVYGILKSGAAFVPLDPSAPHRRTTFLLENCGIQVLITNTLQKKRIGKIQENTNLVRQVIGLSENNAELDLSWEAVFNTSVENFINLPIDGNDLAYIMYTSGSTGVPKGIMHTHNSALAYARLSSELYELNPDDRVGNHAPLHFDISTFGYFSAPLASTTTVIIPDAFTKLPASLASLISKEKISIWYSVPLALIQLYLSETLNKHDYSSLRWVLFGGENFTMKYLKSIMGLWPNSLFSNVYGPAEVNQCTYFNFNVQTTLKNSIPIGKTWNETECKIIDENDKIIKDGQAGELLIHSTTMMQGYWKNPDLTKKSFYIEYADSNTPKLFYRTGDLVKLNSEGQLVFLGRNDRQIKLRGYRIEMDEIEAILCQHQSVNEARVCVIENSIQEKLLVAAIIPVNNANVDITDLILHCKSHLPAYAVPNRIELLEILPRTSSGKIDLNAIKDKFSALEI